MSYILDNKSAVINAIKALQEASKFGYDLSIFLGKHPCTVKLEWTESGKPVCGFTLIEQTNCCGILVSTKTFVMQNYQKRGLAQEMLPLKEEIAKLLGYSLLLATVNVSGNPVEVHILNKFGWKQGESFVNQRTKNTVAVFTKQVT